MQTESTFLGKIEFTYKNNSEMIFTNADSVFLERLGAESVDELRACFSNRTAAFPTEDMLMKRLMEEGDYVTSVSVERGQNTMYFQLEFHILERDDNSVRAVLTVTDVTATAQLIQLKNKNIAVVASLNADFMFEFYPENDYLRLIKNNDGDFNEFFDYYDFRNYVREHSAVYEEDIPAFDKMLSDAAQGRETISGEIRVLTGGEYLWFSVNARKCVGTDGSAMVIGKITNTNRNKDQEIRLINRAQRDPLTKIYNKSTTKQLISDYLRTDSFDNFDALIIIDVDNFKQVNDNLGHLFGDSVLSDLSQEIQDLVRSSDVVGRIGGDEFLVFLRGIKHKNHIEDKAEDICRVFELLYSGEHEEKITGSLGISIFPNDGSTYEELFKKADIALYASKKTGKNCYNFYSEEMGGGDPNEDSLHTNRYERDIPLAEPNDIFDREITDFAFDIMNKTKDVSSAINLLLSKMGKHFSLSRISVVEATEENHALKYTYQWHQRRCTSQLGRVIPLTDSQWSELMSSYDENDIITVTDINTQPDGVVKTIMRQLDLRATMQCAFYDSGEFNGFVCFSEAQNRRCWTIDEVRALKNIAKVVSSYLLKMRAFQKANLMVDRLTNFDKLTGLPHYNKFKAIARDIVNEEGSSGRLALVFWDINNFKYINDKYGSQNGDRLLKAFACYLPDLDAVVKCSSRIFSDKYISLIASDNPYELDKIIKPFLDGFSTSERNNQPDCNITIACGVYVIEEKDDFDINIAVDNVNIANKIAKNYIENTCTVFHGQMKSSFNREIEIVNDAKQALKNHEFVVYYQPKIKLKTSEIVGAEALVRWKKPDGTIIAPNDFLPFLEKNGLITSVDFYVYNEVCRFIRERLDNNKPIVPISINVSRMHLRDAGFFSHLQRLIAQYRIPSNLLEFELTESVFLENQNAAVNTMGKMKELGFLVSIDDFGSGFSSLNLLKSLPVDILKIDKEFFTNDKLMKNDEIVLSSIISMANRMNISVICEGVETADQVKFLRESNCDMVQGYYYARPMPEEQFNDFNLHHEPWKD